MTTYRLIAEIYCTLATVDVEEPAPELIHLQDNSGRTCRTFRLEPGDAYHEVTGTSQACPLSHERAVNIRPFAG